MIAFGSMSDQSGYDKFSDFQFLVASGVLTFVWLLFLLTAYLYDWHSQYSVLNFAVRTCCLDAFTHLSLVVSMHR